MKKSTDIEKIKMRIAKNMEIPYCFNNIHGSNECCFENIAFCIGNSAEEMNDDAVIQFFDFYRKKLTELDEIKNSDFVRTIMMNGLLYIAVKINRMDEALLKTFQNRLSVVYNFTLSGEQIFYSDDEKAKLWAIPKVWRDNKVVRQEHTEPLLRLPLVYDLLGFASMYRRGEEAVIDTACNTDSQENDDMNHKIDAILQYVFSDEYQKQVENGYGVGLNGDISFVKSRYYAVGWDLGVHHLNIKQEALYRRLLTGIKGATESAWYQNSVKQYQKAVEEDDVDFLSALYASARKTYWTGGCYVDFKETGR